MCANRFVLLRHLVEPCNRGNKFYPCVKTVSGFIYPQVLILVSRLTAAAASGACA